MTASRSVITFRVSDNNLMAPEFPRWGRKNRGDEPMTDDQYASAAVLFREEVENTLAWMWTLSLSRTTNSPRVQTLRQLSGSPVGSSASSHRPEESKVRTPQSRINHHTYLGELRRTPVPASRMSMSRSNVGCRGTVRCSSKTR